MLSLSVFVKEQDPLCAPMLIQSRLHRTYHRACCPPGALLLRDVNVLHAGTMNRTTETRCLPSVRFMHADIIRCTDYRPARHVQDSYFKQHFDSIEDQMSYLWSEDEWSETRERDLCDKDSNSLAHECSRM